MSKRMKRKPAKKRNARGYTVPKAPAAPTPMPPPEVTAVPPEPAVSLVLRNVAADMVSRGVDKNNNPRPDFTWPALGPVECPDWDPEPECGHGLHGLLWGDGDWSLLSKAEDALWQVVEVASADVVKIDARKCKFPRGKVLFTGNRARAMTMVLASQRSFERTAALAKAEDVKRAASGYSGHAAAVGSGGVAEASGKAGIACALGDRVAVRAGELGLIVATWWDDTAERFRACVGNVGEDGIEAGVWYIVRDGKLDPAPTQSVEKASV